MLHQITFGNLTLVWRIKTRLKPVISLLASKYESSMLQWPGPLSQHIQNCILWFLTPLKKGDDTQTITIINLLTKCKAKKQTGQHQTAAHISLRETWNAQKQALVRRVSSRDLQSVQAEQSRAGVTAGLTVTVQVSRAINTLKANFCHVK